MIVLYDNNLLHFIT